MNKYIIGVIVVLLCIIWWLKYDNKVLESNNIKYKIGIEKQEETINELKESSNKKDEIIVSVLSNSEEKQKQKEIISEKFNKPKVVNGIQQKRDFENLLMSKPIMLQKRINDATLKEFECIEKISKGDLNACL